MTNTATTDKTTRFFATVVTYNRLSLLPKVIEALRSQTCAVEKIIVVNNGSTDGTTEWLAAQSNLYVVNQANSGGAGGFHTGVKTAYEAGADWVWMMDDDVAPEADCLEQMFVHTAHSECINPLHINDDGSISEEERWFDLTDCTIMSFFNLSYKQGKKTWYRNLGSFEGMMVSRALIEKIGFPDPRFFITHDDLIYGFLASKYTNVVVVADAVMRRQPVVRSFQGGFNYEYYMLRNLWLLEEYATKELPGFDGYRRRRILWQFVYAVYKILFVEKRGHTFKSLQIIYQAYRDYRRKKGGMK